MTAASTERPIDRWFAHYSGDHRNPVNQRRASRAVGFGMLAAFVAMAWLTRWLHDSYGTPGLARLALGVFVLAWIAQFIGHGKRYEGKRPSFFTDLKYLLVGPAWVLAKLYRKLGWSW